MKNIIGVRREDKNKWERRVPITPTQVAQLNRQHNIDFVVQPSPIRALANDAYATAGAAVQEDLSAAGVILAVKEIPLELLLPNKTYLFFSHTIKGQSYNMPLLQRLLDLNCQLIDYEKVLDDNNRRLIFFGRHAGLAGIIDTLHTLGQRLAWEGFDTPLADIRLTYQYGNLAAAKQAVGDVGRRIAEESLPPALTPLVIGVAGYGNVSKGAQEILDLLPTRQISPAELLSLPTQSGPDRNIIYTTVFKEEDTVEPVDDGRPFDLQEFFQHPARYRSRFEQYLPHLSVLANCIYWDTPYPRLLTKAQARRLYSTDARPKLRVIGDISCDIEGGIEVTLKATDLDAPTFVWDPATDTAIDGVAGNGPAIMAVDNLPCELPIEASTHFGSGLLPLIPALATADFSADFDSVELPAALKRGMIVYQGQLTPDYQYLGRFLDKSHV
jgi:alpha-aminoadipic semialdehyde synthase